MTDLHLGKYRLIERLGRGGMAEVFLAEVTGPADFQKVVALKRILPHLVEDPEFVGLFLNEARLAARLNHPNIVQIFDLGEADGSYFLAMEYVDGPSLRTLLKRALQRREFVPPGHAARILADACEGLAFAHDHMEGGRVANLVHRDISPDNVLLSRAGAAKIADFGIAKPAARRDTDKGVIRGKVWYMPPEQLCDEPLDKRTDVYALGVVLYELLCGLLPYDATNEALAIRAILEVPAIPLTERRPDCPDHLWEIASRALEKEPRDRWPDCRVFHRELERFLQARGEIVGTHEVSQLIAGLFHDLGDRPLTEATLERTTLPARAKATAAACPVCGAPLELAHAAGVVADGCRACGGLWLDAGEMQHLANHPEALLELARRFRPEGGEWDLLERRRSCPRCRTGLLPFEFASLRGIQLDRCDTCKGLWLDHGEAEQIEARLAGH